MLGQSDICDDVSFSQTIDLDIIAIPNAGINATVNMICLGDEIVFENNSSGVIDSYNWNFGDGASMTTATGAGPFTISYSTSGIKTITLIATNSIGTDEATFEIEVIEPPVTSFTFVNDNGELTFTNTSTNANSYLWDFGDGNTSTEANPTHVYTQSGTYEITLLGQSDICDDVSFSQTIEVEIINIPSAGLITLLSSVCVGDEVTFENTSTGVIDSILWNFDEGASIPTGTGVGPFTITYNTSGTKTITLIAMNNIGNDTTNLQIEVFESPIPSFTYLDNNGELTFTNTSINANSYLWDFGDGNTSTEENPIHTYAQSGMYEIILLAQSDICDDVTDTLNINVIITSNENFDLDIGADILPNPNDGIFAIKISDVMDRIIEMELIDVSGRVLQRSNIQTTFGVTIYEIKNTPLTSGIYFVKLKNESSVKTLKVIVQ